ncbi:MAG: hypothetical protein QM730_03595 [Anaerolineales bacterium]
MDTNVSSQIRPVITAVIACISIGVVAIVSDSTYFLDGYIATLLLAAAIILPIWQKRFSFYSIVLVISGILVILSGAFHYVYFNVVAPSPIDNQVEFSKFMRPLQVSHGLTTAAIGILHLTLSYFGFQKNKKSENPTGIVLKLFLWVITIAGMFYSVMGINSIIEGLRKF